MGPMEALWNGIQAKILCMRARTFVSRVDEHAAIVKHEPSNAVRDHVTTRSIVC